MNTYLYSLDIMKKLVILSFICILELSVCGVKGECLFQGKLYMNHTLWLPDFCTICTCEDPVAVCEKVRCTTPNCDFSKGEYLQIPADDCCPECVRQLLPCQHQGRTVAHNSEWKPDPCSQCLCYDGEVTCDVVSCPALRCKPGEVSQVLPGQCCQQCIPAGRSCSYDGERYDDGSEWEPIPCTKCVCRDGQTTCYPIQCSPLVCPQDQKMERVSGSCCPVCVGSPCRDRQLQYQDGEHWKRDACTNCVCINGRSICRNKECIAGMKCGKNERNITREGECCSECLPNEEPCAGERPVRYSGDIWNVSNCEFCTCQNGRVQCHKAVCEHLRCSQDEEAVKLPGKCCSECVKSPVCETAGHTYLNDETWHPDACSVCNCRKGEAVCYHTSCPACPDGSVSIVQPGECCGKCQDFPCNEDCATCHPEDASFCTRCRVKGMFLQEGRCVHRCREGMFPTTTDVCQACHETCATCVEGTEHHCETCKPGLLWRNGQCVPRCDRFFYQDEKQCLDCHPSCSFCRGPSDSDCLSCSNPAQVLQRGSCVDSCQTSFYLRNEECLECPPTCRTCSNDGGSCTSCTTGLQLHRGQCLSVCPPGFYPDRYSHCMACHPSCKTCSGPQDTECYSCLDGIRLGSRGRCRMPCRDGQYLHADGSCRSCESGCSKCFPSESGRESVCLQCTDPAMVAFDNVCIRFCPVGHYPQDQICRDCGGGCVECDSPLLCRKCGTALFLSRDRCVRRCTHKQYADWDNQLCTDCPDDCVSCVSGTECVQCSSATYLKGTQCVPNCGAGFFENKKFRLCEENAHSPMLQILGHIQIPEGGAASIPADIFYLSDQDTPAEDLLLELSRTPDNGRLVIATKGRDVALQQGDAFTALDLMTGRVRFIHDAESGSKSMVVLRASDRQLVSEDQVLYIQAVPDSPPQVVLNQPMLATDREITTLGTKVIDFKVSGSPEDIKIDVVEGPRHGKIVQRTLNLPVTTFTLRELQDDRLGYQHNSEGHEERDVLLLQVTDGYYILNVMVNINIREKENLLPMLVNNNVGYVEAGAMLQLTPDLLMAEVMDHNSAPTTDIIYTLLPTVNNPKEGDIIMVVPMPADGPGRGWENMQDGSMAAKMFRFMQRDIDEGRIWYKHKSSQAAKSDIMTFEIADTANPPNILREQSFQIAIMDSAVPTSTPTIAPGVRLGMTVLENQVVPISSSNLAYQDLDTPDDGIVYTITRSLRQGEGTIEHVSNPFQPVTRFTQADINNNRVLYRPPLSDIGVQEKEFSFYFTVTDDQTQSDQSGEQKFSVRVLPVNNMPPRFLQLSPSVTVSQGSTVPLGQTVLAVSDGDTASSDLVMTLTQAPKHGRIEKNQVGGLLVIREGESFQYSEMMDTVLQYTHDGSSQPLSDTVQLKVSDGAHHALVKVNITIIRVDRSAPAMLTSATCRINIREGEVSLIQRTDLGFEDEDDADDMIRIILTSQPVHGKLFYRKTRQLQQRAMFTQADINNGLISYQSDREIGSQPITEVLVFDVVDTSGNKLTNQVLSVIIEPVNNQAPLVTVGSTIQVEEGAEAPITVQDIRVTDPDSHLSSLTVTIHTPPVFGEIQSTKSDVQGSEEVVARSVRSFSVQDLVDGHISYVQNSHENKEPVWDGFLFIVSDGQNDSPTHRFNISIKLVNDESPLMVTEQLFVKEDNSVLLTNASMYVVDLDNSADELIFTLDKTPKHGTLSKRRQTSDAIRTARPLSQGQSFTYQDVLDELIIYHHMGEELSSDSFTLTITDGDFSSTKTLDVVIGLVNDETPRVSINRGLRVQSGSTTPIKPKDLRCTDIDSDDTKLKYTMKRDPAGGRLRMHRRDRVKPQVISTSGSVKSFLQEDINNGLLEYQHRPGEITGVVTFKFDVADPEGNVLIDQIFYITILEDRVPPEMLTSRELVVSEGSEAKITTEFLSFTDTDSEPGALQYFLLSAPLLGHLELTDNPGVPISEFTQSDLAANSVIYVHKSSQEVHFDHFTFTVTDGTNEVTHKFSIVINPVDDKIPVVTNNGLRVQEGIRKIITEFDLKAVDQDTEEDSLLFQVVQPPLHGSLDVQKGTDYINSVSFTMMDIYQGKVSYQHDGSNTLQDNFSFTVTDGSNEMFAMQSDHHRGDIFVPQTAPGEFRIQILPMDDGSPVLEINHGLQFLEHSQKNPYNMITSRELHAVDVDTVPGDLVFIIKQNPRYGRLETTANPSVQLSSFTQEDVDSGVIRYVLTSGIDKLEDSFIFDLVDKKPNLIPGNVFHIMWSVIGFEELEFNVTETAGVIRLPVVRQGNIKQYSIVTCKTVPGSATSTSVRSRPGTQDYIHHAGQVQFDEWQEAKVCTIIINDDSIYERAETFYVELEEPVYSLLSTTKYRAGVNIHDTDDEPVINFKDLIYHVEESDTYLSAVMTRSGDLESTVSAVCSTIPLTARGSSLSRLESGSDYISRGTSSSYRIVFPPGVTTVACEVKLVDDSEYETAEQFELVLSDPSTNSRLGSTSRATVIIEGPNDESGLHLSVQKFHFDENAGDVEIEIVRTGADLSHDATVWCATKLSEPPSATPGQDYIPSSSQIMLGPGQRSGRCHLTILDDEADPRLEGNETFTVFLSSPTGSVLSEPYTATVYIHDSHLDVPMMQFGSDNITVSETDLLVNVPVVRSGDLSFESSVVCYTRQNSARVSEDFVERAMNNASRIVFKPGEKTKNCTVVIVDDNDNEEKEVFHIQLTDARGTESCEARVGKKIQAKVTITNVEDEPTIEFEHSAYSIHEPGAAEKLTTLVVKILRSGDLSHESSVRCSTRDGSAVSGVDYNPRSQIITFRPGVDVLDFPVDILHNSDIEWHESFSVVLGPEPAEGAVLGHAFFTTVTILDDEVSGSLVFPAPPVVVSLLHYDDVETGTKSDPSPGYPLVCVTACDEHYPTYTITHSLCQEMGVNQSSVLYRWEIGMPFDDHTGTKQPFVMVSDATLFTSVDRIVLDSIYFRPSFRVRCIAQPLHENGNPGIPSKSAEVVISHESGICKSPVFHGTPHSYGAQSFLAKLDYVGADDAVHPNTIHISIQIPHQDGHLPLISTYPLHNLEYLLAEPVYRQQHLCSNLITPQERSGIVDSGFLDYSVLYAPAYKFPYQFDTSLRENKTLVLYRHLNLKSCVWTFNAWYHMADLVDVCGGKIISDFQVKGAGQTYLTVTVPLYVYYVYATAPVGWGSLQHHTEMEFSFYYDSILWQTGLEMEGGRDKIGGDIQVLKVLVGNDGKLVIDFKTHAKFRGLYVIHHHTLPELESRILPPDDIAITFDLSLVWGQQTFDSPHQLWRATSNFNLKDYTGTYVIELIPCTVSPTQVFTSSETPIPCTAHQPQRFEIPLAFQQSNRPVPLVYSLNTKFQLTNNRDLFMIRPDMVPLQEELDYDDGSSFSVGQKIYGRVLWNPEQDLREAYRLVIQKVYLCTGRDGFVPTYDPKGEVYGDGPQFGCIQPSNRLRYRFLILDRGNPDVVQRDFQSVPFDAHFAGNVLDLVQMEDQPGTDGFVMSVDPLFKVVSGNQWYLQVVYVISKADSAKHHYRNKRSNKRDVFGQEVTPATNGTNMVIVSLDLPQEEQTEQESSALLPVLLPVVTVVIIVIVIAVVCCLVMYKRRRRKQKSKNCPRKSNIEIAQQNSLRYQNRQNMLSLSKINVNIVEVNYKNSVVHKGQKDKTCKVKIKNTNIKTQGKRKLKSSGTEV